VVRVKICGITNLEDALTAVESGADAVGFVVFKGSKRFVHPKDVRRIAVNLPPFVAKVGVFVNENPRAILEILSYAHLDFAQLHGDEPPETCDYIGKDRVIKAVRLKCEEDISSIEQYTGKVGAVLIDSFSPNAYGGTGKTLDWSLAEKVVRRFQGTPVILSGGLKPENVAGAVAKVQPFGVDVSSGVEKFPGKKDHEKLKLFVKSAKCGK